ncbi:hypothetical protein [Nitratidesulfovibrio liaohensis]|uniref:YcaO domain-containing protein n=1 Tax=Nitratidesulfovibrio liaohensis TaxID=2604158 RepID=A0ABY9R664_9BACT|nr:hypothetical protein [Nitratidesulfovibrio liaohensis]WMW66919.1 hypothetical protein KPS_001550 [Nitratidesulfovibrio liaohensis]
MHHDSIHLRLYADMAWLPLAQGVAEQGAAVFGLDHGKTLRLTMAVEELLAYLAGQSAGDMLEITITRRACHILTEFAFAARDADLWAMNITACGVSCSEESMQAMGLLLAARMCDGFEVRRHGGQVVLSLRMNRSYPGLDGGAVEHVAARGALQVRAADDPARIKEACRLACGLYPPALVPPSFATPGMVVDQVRAGDLHAALAEDAGGAVRGFIVWMQRSEASVSFCGPYVFARDDAQTARALTDHLVAQVARTTANGIISDLATADLPPGEFEALGELPFTGDDDMPAPLPVWYRGLREDNGVTVWAHAGLKLFLEQAYERLFLMRDIRPTQPVGEHRDARSVFATSLRPQASVALITPMLDGADAGENIRLHAGMLRAEGYRNILLHLDLSAGWQADLPPLLEETGFAPVMVLPFASRADVVVYQHVRV